MVLKKKWDQGCTVPNLCSWATRKSYIVLSSYKSRWAPWISQVQSTWLPSIFLRAQLGIAKT